MRTKMEFTAIFNTTDFFKEFTAIFNTTDFFKDFTVKFDAWVAVFNREDSSKYLTGESQISDHFVSD